MADVPNLSGIATEDLVDTIGTGSFSARYINWAKTLNLLHEHAPGWLPHIVHQENGEIVYSVADSAYVLIYFIHTDETSLPPVMQAIMDNRHKAIPFDKITAVDVSNAVVRGYCKAAAVSFGLAYELWSGDQMESGYSTDEQKIIPAKELKQEIKIAEELDADESFVFNPDWRSVKIHFGKNDGKALDDLSEKQLSWYCSNYHPGFNKDGSKSDYPPSEIDMALRHAFTSSITADSKVKAALLASREKEAVAEDLPF
eukprot:GHVR01145682.1.p1 GENE.GHVR01145682.1~~GHVR01145682.1.p1  ORF type:complete len:257 (-),score=21.17 GHVR01145682.1:37-807(-)